LFATEIATDSTATGRLDKTYTAASADTHTFNVIEKKTAGKMEVKYTQGPTYYTNAGTAFQLAAQASFSQVRANVTYKSYAPVYRGGDNATRFDATGGGDESNPANLGYVSNTLPRINADIPDSSFTDKVDIDTSTVFVHQVKHNIQIDSATAVADLRSETLLIPKRSATFQVRMSAHSQFAENGGDYDLLDAADYVVAIEKREVNGVKIDYWRWYYHGRNTNAVDPLTWTTTKMFKFTV
jgi:hypothetical protein